MDFFTVIFIVVVLGGIYYLFAHGKDHFRD